MIRIEIGAEESGCRLDRILRKRLKLMSLSQIYSLMRRGGVRIDGRKARQDYRVQDGDLLEIDASESELAASSGPDNSLKAIVNTEYFKRNFKIIYQDSDLLACDKPSGLVVHPGTGHLHRDTLIELATGYLLQKGSLKEGEEPALVHRIDRDTSGVILIAKNKRTTRKLHETFRQHDIIKQYIAVCHHRPPELEGSIELKVSRTHEQKSGTKMAVAADGKSARSKYYIREYHDDLSRVEVFLETGITHQIRVQMAHLGCPIVGDLRYGDSELDRKVLKNAKNRLYLHAFRLSFLHPVTGKRIKIEAHEPKEFSELMRLVAI
ncbi:MAG TPA: RluA family pseudouridine synthase [Chitinispirillaceae bacterium]|jgi:RluA family pseudouridine synthase|nr:RluA family pseudouridine synthase [Chitinispirillaceae bacterium]